MPIPAKCINETAARNLYTEWQATRASWIKAQRGGVDDTCEFVYSVEELQEFLTYVVAESTAQGITDPGIRIYFGAYNKKGNTNATVFLSPTVDGTKSSANNYSIESMNIVDGGEPPIAY